MTDTPMHSAEWHARRAETLTDLARSASMAGWFKRNRRRDMLAAAQTHAILGAAAVPVDDVMGRLRALEDAANEANARAFVMEEHFDGVEDALRSYGQDLLAGATPAEAVGRLMAWRFNGEDIEAAGEAQR